MTRYFFSSNGDYLGGFEGDSALSLVPSGAIEVSEPPNHGLDRLVNGVMEPYIQPVSLSEQLLGIFNSLSEDAQATFYPIKIQIQDALKLGKIVIARKIIENLQVPEGLIETKNNVLQLFN